MSRAALDGDHLQYVVETLNYWVRPFSEAHERAQASPEMDREAKMLAEMLHEMADCAAVDMPDAIAEADIYDPRTSRGAAASFAIQCRKAAATFEGYCAYGDFEEQVGAVLTAGQRLLLVRAEDDNEARQKQQKRASQAAATSATKRRAELLAALPARLAALPFKRKLEIVDEAIRQNTDMGRRIVAIYARRYGATSEMEQRDLRAKLLPAQDTDFAPRRMLRNDLKKLPPNRRSGGRSP